MEWYWIVAIVFGYPFIAGIFTGLLQRYAGDDYIYWGALWPITLSLILGYMIARKKKYINKVESK